MLAQEHGFLWDKLPLYKALSAETRIEILELLTQSGPMRLTDISEELHITPGALTPHIKLLQESGLIRIEHVPASRGVQKMCSIREEVFRDAAGPAVERFSVHDMRLKVGQFDDWRVNGGCGFSMQNETIKTPNCFKEQRRLAAEVLWLENGYIEYNIPSFVNADGAIREVLLSAEIAGVGEICVDINGVRLLAANFPAPFIAGDALYTPQDWNESYAKHGLLTYIRIDENGTSLNGNKVSETRIGDCHFEKAPAFQLRISGNFILFGEQFGNYRQDIRIRINCENQ